MGKPSKGTSADGRLKENKSSSRSAMNARVAEAMMADDAYDMAHHIVENSPADKKRDAAVRARAMRGK